MLRLFFQTNLKNHSNCITNIIMIQNRPFASRQNDEVAVNVPSYPVAFNSELETAMKEVSSSRLAVADYNGVGKMRCYNCGQMGHLSYDCRLPQVRKACYLCGNTGHKSRDCPDRLKVTVCYYCQKTGHITTSCPDRIAARSNTQSSNKTTPD